jgi:tRNA (guanine-N7-)-methyltransferase
VIKPEYKNRDIRSYVIRGGRITDGQKNAFDQWWPVYGLSLKQGNLDAREVFGNNNPVVLEIGYGNGDSLVDMAASNPDTNYVGVEVHTPGVGRLVNEAGKRDLRNLRTYCADAIDVLEDCIGEGSLSRVQIFFPDPWHKKKHHKRRLIQPAFIDLVSSRLLSGGILHLATDWQEYGEEMREVLDQCKALENTGEGFVARPDFRPLTKFERRGNRLGHQVSELVYRKKPA